MLKIKLFDVLKALSKDELKKFSEYLSSPLFNKRKVLYDLYGIYKKYHPEFSDTNLTKEKVFKKLFPGKEYSDELFRNLNSLLLGLAEDFLSFLNYSTDHLTMKKHMLAEINHRKILTLFEKNFEQSVKTLETSGNKDFNYFYNLYMLYLQKDIFNSIINKFSKEDITLSEKSMLTFFVIKILELQNYILYQCKVLGKDRSLFLNEKFIDTLIKKIPEELTELPQVRIYYNSYKLEVTGNERYYTELKRLLGKYGSLLKKEEIYNKYIDLIDYIKTKHSTKEIKTNSELFQLRKEIIEKNLLMENTIKNMFFLNLVKSGLKIGEFEWIYDFINKYKSLLIPKYREITLNLSLALYHFEKAEYERSLSYAAQIKYEDNFYNLQAKNLTVRIFYETDQLESLLNSISSYRMYLSKNRTLTEEETSSHNMFLNFMDKIIRIREQNKFTKLNDLVFEMNELNFVNNYWLIDKANALIKKSKINRSL